MAVHRTDAGVPRLTGNPDLTPEEHAWLKDVAAWGATEGAYGALHRTKPQTAAMVHTGLKFLAAADATQLAALSAPRGAADTRSHEQRYHDALEEAMRRLVTAGLLPERAGQPAKVIAHISLADLRDLDTDSALQKQWAARVHAAWAARRAAASVSGSDGGAWLEGDAARGFGCDAGVTPIVTGEVNPAVALVSGPDGLASFLRRRELGGRLGGPSLPLDVGVSRDIPAAIRTAVIQRDQHCPAPGDTPAAYLLPCRDWRDLGLAPERADLRRQVERVITTLRG